MGQAAVEDADQAVSQGAQSHLRSPFDSLPTGLDWLIPQVADATTRRALSRLVSTTKDDGPSSPRARSLLVEAHYLRVLHALTGHVIRSATHEPPADKWTQAGFRIGDPDPWGGSS